MWKEDKGEGDNDGDLLAPFSDPIDIERPRARTLSLSACLRVSACVLSMDGCLYVKFFCKGKNVTKSMSAKNKNIKLKITRAAARVLLLKLNLNR